MIGCEAEIHEVVQEVLEIKGSICEHEYSFIGTIQLSGSESKHIGFFRIKRFLPRS